MINPLTHSKILKKGVPGRARILGMSTPARGARTFNMSFTLLVEVQGLPPYEVQDQWLVSAKASLAYGASLPVKVDQKDPQQVAIDWDQYAAEVQAADQARRDYLASLPPVGSPAAAGMTPPVSPGSVQNIDARNDPELRAKLEQALGRTLTPGSTEQIDLASDPAAAALVMQIVTQHRAQQAASPGVASPGFSPPPAPGVPPAATAAPSGMDQVIGQIERLDALRRSGAITQAEFDAAKRKLLG